MSSFSRGIVCYCVVLHASISMSSFSHGPPNTSWLRPTLRSPDKTPPKNFLYFVLLNLWETMTLWSDGLREFFSRFGLWTVAHCGTVETQLRWSLAYWVSPTSFSLSFFSRNGHWPIMVSRSDLKDWVQVRGGDHDLLSLSMSSCSYFKERYPIIAKNILDKDWQQSSHLDTQLQ